MRQFDIIGSLWRGFWRLVWRSAEACGVDLGRFAPWVFGQMIGSRGREVRK
ncbi:MAG: hypothetical protein MOB07_26135 [Acidobacteria bacterium]|nr:hypothetical protein [Acidobacteriota bacterium]